MTTAVSSTTLRRLMKEYQTEQKQEQEQQRASSSTTTSSPSPLPRKQATRDENILILRPKDAELKDLLHWTATVKGPLGGCYEGEYLLQAYYVASLY